MTTASEQNPVTELYASFQGPQFMLGSYDHTKPKPLSFQLVLLSFSKNIFFLHLYRVKWMEKYKWKRTTAQEFYEVLATYIYEKKRGGGTMFMAEQDLQVTFYRTKKNKFSYM